MKKNIKKNHLEDAFAEDFSTPLFPLLADIYLAEGDIKRAAKVCEIGLSHDEFNTDGKFVAARVALMNQEFLNAEKLLKSVVTENRYHFNALRLLIDLELQLNRSLKTVKKYINTFLNYFPNDHKCREILSTLNIPPEKKDSTRLRGSKNIHDESPSSVKYNSPVTPYSIDESMATLTMVKILKKQKHYNQALSVLKLLESSGHNQTDINTERQKLTKLISNSE